jgi:cyclic beta-1,2-glucan synthetase
MKVTSKIDLGSLLHFRTSFPENDLAEQYAGGDPPLRSELFSADQMEQHGKTLAALHRLSPGQAPDQLLSRLAENEGVLSGVRDLLAEAVKANRRITPAGEWLLNVPLYPQG